MAGPVAKFPPEETDVHDWVKEYIASQKKRMDAEVKTGGTQPPSRAEVTNAVRAKFGEGSGRAIGILTWMRILYWVAFILLSL